MALDAAGPGVVRDRQAEGFEQPVQRSDVARLGIADVDERPDFTEVGDHPVVGRPGAVFLIQRLVQRVDFGLTKPGHVVGHW